MLLDSQLSYTNHVNEVASKAMRTLGFIKRNTREFTHVPALVTLYKTLVQPTLEYASIVWSPHYGCHVEQLERVYRAFLRYIAFKLGIPRDDVEYSSLSQKFHLLRPADRRAVADLSFLHGLVSGRIDSPLLLEQIGLRVPRAASRVGGLFAVPFSSTNYLYHRPLCRLPRTANYFASTPPFIDLLSTSLASLKSTLTIHLLNSSQPP